MRFGDRLEHTVCQHGGGGHGRAQGAAHQFGRPGGHPLRLALLHLQQGAAHYLGPAQGAGQLGVGVQEAEGFLLVAAGGEKEGEGG